MEEFSNDLQNKGVNSTLVDGTNMDEALQKIVSQIITPAYTNVVIEDTLSDNVEFAEENPNFTVQYTVNGTTRTLPSDQYRIVRDGKKITLKLLDGKELSEGIKYSISFRVKPFQSAIDEYSSARQYPDRGDAGTDAPGNFTSSNMPGFYSNTTAVVKYNVNGSK